MRHRGRRSVESLEYRKARAFCFRNSKYDPKLQERVFVGTAEEAVNFVRIAVSDPIEALIPDTPQGLVLADNRCTGAFQRNE